MQLERKMDYYLYIQEMERLGIAYVPLCDDELIKKFPELDERKAKFLINMYIKEEIEPKKTMLLG